MKVEELIQKFEDFDTEKLNKYEGLLSSKYDGEIFPPYIPHIGENYNKYKIMMYGMAQSYSAPWDELIKLSKIGKVKQLYDAEGYHDIAIAPYKIMLAIAGVYIYAKHLDPIGSFCDIHKFIAVTNYYKFSFSDDKGNDINPDSHLEEPEVYWSENDELSKYELDFLQSSIVISFNGRHNKVIEEQGYGFIRINDPSWILRGGSGVLSKNGSWFRETDDSVVDRLVDGYVNQIDGQYSGKKEAIKIYLMKYYNDWKNT